MACDEGLMRAVLGELTEDVIDEIREAYRMGYEIGYADREHEATTKGLDLPEASDEIPTPYFMDEMKKEFDKLWDSWVELKGKLCQAERRIERLEK